MKSAILSYRMCWRSAQSNPFVALENLRKVKGFSLPKEEGPGMAEDLLTGEWEAGAIKGILHPAPLLISSSLLLHFVSFGTVSPH
jgi:hypothetical protein